MFGRGHKRNRHRGCEGGGPPYSFFDGRRSTFNEHRRRKTQLVNPPPALSSSKEPQSDNEVFHEIKDYLEEAKRGEPV